MHYWNDIFFIKKRNILWSGGIKIWCCHSQLPFSIPAWCFPYPVKNESSIKVVQMGIILCICTLLLMLTREENHPPVRVCETVGEECVISSCSVLWLQFTEEVTSFPRKARSAQTSHWKIGTYFAYHPRKCRGLIWYFSEKRYPRTKWKGEKGRKIF